MLRDILTLSALILVVLLVRAIFKNRVPKRMIYALWLVVLLKLCLPGTLFSLPVLPAEDAAAPTQSAELPVQTAPVVQQPAQTVTQPQTPVQQPVSPAQETVKPTTKPLTTAQILQIVWFSGSALLGLWLFGAWAVFTIRLHRDRRFLGKRGGTCIYVSDAVKSPCLAGLIPAVYLTEDVLKTDAAELILSHELTHLRHLDFLWSFCRAAAVSVYWWNPLIWVAAICSKRDAELACDEAVAAKLPESKRLAYARAILAQAPRNASALSLAGPPVKERILFLTKKQRTSAICIVLALALTISATGCSFAELTRRKTNAPASSTEEAQSETEPQAETAPEPVAEKAQPERTSLEEELPVDEAARAEWFDFADRWRLDYLPVFSRGAAPASTSEYLMWVFSRNMDALKEQGSMTKEYVETQIKTHFELGNLMHEGLSKVWDYDGEVYAAVSGGVNDRPLTRLDSVLTANIGGKQIYYVQYSRMGNGNLLDDVQWNRYRDEIISGETPDLSGLREDTLSFYMQDGEPVFLSHTELNIEEPPFTPLPNDGTYDVTQPLQEWELTRTNGVQTGMTQAQVEEITGPLTTDQYGYWLLDSQNVSYSFGQNGYQAPQLMEMNWSADVRNDELFYVTAQDTPAFRGICLGDTIDEVLDKFPCVDRELKQWAEQYVYGEAGTDNYAELSFVADSFYSLSFFLHGQRRATIGFSRVQQRVFEITISAEENLKDTNPWQAVDAGFLRDSALREELTADLSKLPDDLLLAFLSGTEVVQTDDGFTFDNPGELSSDELFRLFLWWTNRSALEKYRNPDDGWFYFPSSAIHRTLDCYFSGYCFDITACRAYDRQTGMVVVPSVSGSDDGRTARLVGKAQDGDLVTYLIDFYADAAARAEHRAYARKEYTLQCYDGGFYLLRACSVMCPDREHTLGGISVWDRWDLLPQTVTEGFENLGVVGVSREDYDVVKYGRDGLYVHVLRLQAGKEDREGLDGYVSCVYTTSPDYPSPRGLRVGDPEANAAETMNALWGSFEYELQDGVICRMGFFSYYDAGGPGEAFTVRPADSRPGN